MPGGEEPERARRASHPWLALLVLLLLSVLVLGIVGTVVTRGLGLPQASRLTGFVNATTAHLIVLFVIAPLLLGCPRDTGRSVPMSMRSVLPACDPRVAS
ncbi:MAG: hypothetical protein GF330_13435 [Candidatus Eisenbacteria bacterium]|nr:hypothetical protein [Candidatus Eisenbacteria bacterium]